MRLFALALDETGRELTVRGEPGYPIAMYDFELDGFLRASVPWHWHRETEALFLRRGELCVETEAGRAVLTAGQGAFINSGVLHRMYRAGGPDGNMVSLAFDPLLISGAETSVFHSRYVLPLLRCRALPSVWLTGEAPWHGRALDCLRRAWGAYRSGAFGCELAVRQALSEAWLLLLRENRALLEAEPPAPRDGRIKTMLRYLQEHLAEPVRLEDVAASAGVSARECTRCFRATLGVTPIYHLTQLRVRAAALLLETTDDPVTEIGLSVGFESPSYFGRVFRRHTGLSPREYRRGKHGART